MTHNTEVEKIVEEIGNLLQEGEYRKAVATLHHQLQKAREEGEMSARLSEHPERLALWNEAVEEGRRRERLPQLKMLQKLMDKAVTVSVDEHGLFNMRVVSVNEIQTIIDRYQAELDQDKV